MRRTFLPLLVPCLAVNAYYAAVAPPITSVAHLAALLLGAALYYVVELFSV